MNKTYVVNQTLITVQCGNVLIMHTNLLYTLSDASQCKDNIKTENYSGKSLRHPWNMSIY
jgi:hypothetical protein